MKRFLVPAIAVLALALSAPGVLAQTPPSSAPPGSIPPGKPPHPDVSTAAHHDVSPPLRTLKPASWVSSLLGARPLRRLPRPQPAQGKTVRVQTQIGTAAAPSLSTNFEGIGQGFSGPAGTFTVSSAPPDTDGAVGPNHYVQIVNQDFAVFNKSGTALYGPVPTNTLWSGFGGGCQTNNDGDAVVEYDRSANRWLISQFSVSTTPYLQCVAISQTGDPTGAYYRYSFSYTDFPDYPKFGVWPDAYYVTFNMFAGGSTFTGGKVCAYNRTAMLSGQPATQQCFNVGTSYGGLLPSDLDGSRQPPAGSPNYILALGATANTLALWKFHVDWSTPANTTLTGPTTLTTGSFSEACGGGTCIPQAGTTQQLDSLADRLMFRLAYRNFGDHEALVVNHSVTAGSAVGIRWYEIRSPSSAPTIYQQGTYAPDSSDRWMGSIAMDQSGDMALGFSLSSSSLHPEIHYTGRLAGDALGQMTQGEGTIINGAGSQSGQNLSRWGDYSSMSVDPSDDCTFWYTDEYLATTGAFNWHTRISSFKFSNCGSTTTSNDFSISASPSSLSLVQGSSGTSTISTAVTSGSAQTVNLTVSGVPLGASASLNPTSVTAGGSSTLTVNAGTAAAGTYTLTVTGTGTSATHSTTVTLTVTSSSGGGITNGGFETGNFSGWTTGGAATSISTTAHSGSYSAMLGSTSPTNGDSSISQTFTVPSTAGTLSFWYQVHCPDTVTYDWATATLKDNTTGTTTTVLGKTCTNSGAWVQASTGVTAGHSVTLTLISHDDNYTGDPTYTLYDDVALAAASTSSGIVNGGFETGTFSGWTTSGASTSITTVAHSGSYAALAGSTSPTNGDSSISQTFTVPSTSTKLSLYYANNCPDTVTYDWVTVTLKDNTTGTTTTVVPKTCAATYTWTQASSAVTAGHSYTLTLTNHDDNYPGDPTYTLFDDVTLS